MDSRVEPTSKGTDITSITTELLTPIFTEIMVALREPCRGE